MRKSVNVRFLRTDNIFSKVPLLILGLKVADYTTPLLDLNEKIQLRVEFGL